MVSKVFSFSSDHTFDHNWETPLNEEERLKLGQIPNKLGRHTYLGAALQRVEMRSRDLPFRDKFLIVLSDGIPHDGEKAIQLVAILERKGVDCIGLGVGPETANLRRYFREGLFEVDPRTVALELAHIIRSKLLD